MFKKLFMMKKLSFVLLLSLSFLFVKSYAQCPLTEAVDFTVTDLEGNEYQLFDILDNQNKYVLIDFFYTTCGPCQQTAPKVNNAYEYFGCNNHDVVFLAIDNGDNNAQCEAFDQQFGVHYPTISGTEGGGNAVCAAYGIGAYPTVILIAPDHTIVEQDIWPIPTAQTLINILEGYGLTEQNCDISVDEIMDVTFDVFPNPSNGIVNIQTDQTETYTIKVYDISGKMVFENCMDENQKQIDLTGVEKGMYILHFSNDKHQFRKELIIR